MMGLIPTGTLTPWLVAGVLAFSGVALGGAYFKGRADGRAAVIERLQSDRITILKDGRKIDDEVLGADDDALCALLGGCGLPEPDSGD
jgi:hypothetical protein